MLIPSPYLFTPTPLSHRPLDSGEAVAEFMPQQEAGEGLKFAFQAEADTDAGAGCGCDLWVLCLPALYVCVGLSLCASLWLVCISALSSAGVLVKCIPLHSVGVSGCYVFLPAVVHVSWCR